MGKKLKSEKKTTKEKEKNLLVMISINLVAFFGLV